MREMHSNSLISVIVPAYKVEPYLDRCVQSIVDQTYTSLEIILVDDGSPDNCPSMCDKWAKKDKRIKVIHKKNGGLSDARNAGMAASTGEYIAFVDSDDWIAPEMLERLVKALQKDGSDIAACTVEMVWEDKTPSCFLTVQTNSILNRQEAQEALLDESLLKHPVWYKLYRRETVQSIAFEVGKIHEDVFWSYQAIGRAKKVSIIDYVGYYYFQRKGSIMGTRYSLARLDALEAREKWYQYIEQSFPELKIKARVALWENCIYHGQMALQFLQKNSCDEVFGVVESITKKYPLSWQDYSNKKMTHRLWLSIARISMKAVCRIKNQFGVGR